MPVAGHGPMLDPSACNRTIPVFDGAGRFDVTLSFASAKTVDVPGYKGPVLVCQARYTPIAGHRTGRKATQFMAENRDMEAWLAPVENTRMLVPVKISVRTMIGTTVIDATRWRRQRRHRRRRRGPRPEQPRPGTEARTAPPDRARRRRSIPVEPNAGSIPAFMRAARPGDGKRASGRVL